MGGGAIDDYPQHPYTDGDVTMADMAAGLKEVDPLSFASTEELEQELARRKRLGLIKQDDKKFGKSIAVPQGLSPTEEERLSQIAIQNMLAEEQQHVATEAKKSMSKEAAKRMQSAHTHSALFYTCSLCTHKIKVDFTHTISTCSHVFCRDCLASYAKTQIDIQELPITVCHNSDPLVAQGYRGANVFLPCSALFPNARRRSLTLISRSCWMANTCKSSIRPPLTLS
eukprot:GEZU01010675.1.p1 GENE.GEZU01010675.1~~GEZU01010675.1.p1  ORF type:complete len:227 (+),score=22.77 GEZU01010675.1:75-755(+)